MWLKNNPAPPHLWLRTTDLVQHLYFATGESEALAGKETLLEETLQIRSRSEMRCQSAEFQVTCCPLPAAHPRSFSTNGSPLSESEIHLPGDSFLLGISLDYLEAIRKYLRFQIPQQPYLAHLPAACLLGEPEPLSSFPSQE